MNTRHSEPDRGGSSQTWEHEQHWDNCLATQRTAVQKCLTHPCAFNVTGAVRIHGERLRVCSLSDFHPGLTPPCEFRIR